MANWLLDHGYHLDEEQSAVIVHEMEFSLEETYISQLFVDRYLEHETELSIDLVHTVSLDLLRLIPEKFWNSEILQDYIDETELFVGGWLTSVRDIVKLLNPDTVGSMEYLRKLGTLIGVDFSPEDETTETKMRREIVHAVEWYKIKGTYQAIQVMAMIQQFTFNVYDMYTKDYSTFYMVDWFVGNENENPPGFDSSYYKSPHFGLEVVLDKVYEGSALSISGWTGYLWKAIYLDNLYLRVDKMRPVHTVPHFMLLLNPKTDEFGHTIEVNGRIQTRVLGQWEYSTKYFDMTGEDAWNFDSGVYFDQSSESFIKSITKWVLGTGSCPCYLEDSDFVIENPVLTGSIDPNNIIITNEKITFEFIVPKVTTQDGISELGLYIPGTPDKLVVASCFPKIDKDSRVALRVLVEVFKKDLL